MRVEIDIGSMHCEHCAANIERYLHGQPGVETATVDYEEGRGRMITNADVNVATLVQTIDAMGYDASIREDH